MYAFRHEKINAGSKYSEAKWIRQVTGDDQYVTVVFSPQFLLLIYANHRAEVRCSGLIIGFENAIIGRRNKSGATVFEYDQDQLSQAVVSQRSTRP